MFLWNEHVDGIQDCLLEKLPVCLHCVSVGAVVEEAFFCLLQDIFNPFPMTFVVSSCRFTWPGISCDPVNA